MYSRECSKYIIDILMSTYNGSKFLQQQLDSIINQTYVNWRLIIRDDGSSDTTLDIIENYAIAYPDRIKIVDRGTANLGSSKSFERLLDFVESDYFMFSDQDDIWCNNKIECSFKEMLHIEDLYGKNMPLMVCADAKCIDSDGKDICDSFFESQKFIDTTKNDISLLALNVVQGSTALMNKKVMDYIRPFPNYVQHDQWIAVITAHYGKVSYLHEPLLLYRQHGHNVLGALNIGASYFMKKMGNIKKQTRIYYSFYKNLPFRPNIIKWSCLKIYYSLKRL